MSFAFIKQHGAGFPVAAMCRVLAVSKSGFYRWAAHPAGKREARRRELVEAIRAVHTQNREVYGSPRVHRALLSSGRRACRNTVAKLMRQQGLRARTHERFRVKTTDSEHAHPVAPNLLDRRFQADRPNEVWLVDITFIPTDEGFLHLAGVMDLFSRRIIGWSMADHMRAELVRDALNMALAARRPGTGLLHHSDRGSQYACGPYRRVLEARGITVSMSGRGDCYDNAPKESFWARFKCELVHLAHFPTRQAARDAVFEYIEVFYNRTRLHSALGFRSPEQFERDHSS
jgi:putative transposase